MRHSWWTQIVTIESKGQDAFLAGKTKEDNPYLAGYGNQNGAGGQLQRLRRAAWDRGFELAERQKKEGG